MATLTWFGPEDFTARRGTLGRVAIPVGQACVICHQIFGADSAGVVVPFFGDMTVTQEPHHFQCFLSSIGIDEGGQRHEVVR